MSRNAVKKSAAQWARCNERQGRKFRTRAEAERAAWKR